MISEKMIAALNAQISIEAISSSGYLAMSAWCETRSMKGCAAFLRRQSEEERMHMLKLYDYVAECNAHAITPSIAQPQIEFGNVIEVFQKAYEAEKRVTAAILKLVELCYTEHDYLTLNFLQWYLMEQREEEAQAMSILDRITLIGEGPQTLYYIDKELERFNAANQNKGEK